MATNRIFCASYQRSLELIAAGCPIDFPDALTRSDAKRRRFRVKQLAGYIESSVFKFSTDRIGYVIALSVGTEHTGGTVITKWSFDPPWPNQRISWDYEPANIIPERYLVVYQSVINSRLIGVMNDRRLVRRGYPIQGLLCGCAFQPILESGDIVSGKLTVVDDAGNVVATRIDLAVRPAYSPAKLVSTRARYLRSAMTKPTGTD